MKPALNASLGLLSPGNLSATATRQAPRRTNGSAQALPGRSTVPPLRKAMLPPQAVATALRDPVLGGLLPTAAGSAQAANGSQSGPEAPDQVLLLYCTQGRGWCHLHGTKHALTPGNLVVIPTGVPYTCGPDTGQAWTIAWVNAVGSNLPAFLSELGLTLESPVLVPGENPHLAALFEEVLEALEGSCTRPRLWYAAQTLGHLLGTVIWRCSTQGRGEPDLRRRIEQSIAYMRQHLAKPLHVAALAALVNVSPSYYAILFKRHTASAPIDYFIRLRMEHARHLLEETSLHIKQIAVAVGYDDPFYFSRVFKSVTGFPPTDYREQHRRAAANALLNGNGNAGGVPETGSVSAGVMLPFR